jgi:hypothetical protein
MLLQFAIKCRRFSYIPLTSIPSVVGGGKPLNPDFKFHQPDSRGVGGQSMSSVSANSMYHGDDDVDEPPSNELTPTIKTWTWVNVNSTR